MQWSGRWRLLSASNLPRLRNWLPTTSNVWPWTWTWSTAGTRRDSKNWKRDSKKTNNKWWTFGSGSSVKSIKIANLSWTLNNNQLKKYKLPKTPLESKTIETTNFLLYLSNGSNTIKTKWSLGNPASNKKTSPSSRKFPKLSSRSKSTTKNNTTKFPQNSFPSQSPSNNSKNPFPVTWKKSPKLLSPSSTTNLMCWLKNLISWLKWLK